MSFFIFIVYFRLANEAAQSFCSAAPFVAEATEGVLTEVVILQDKDEMQKVNGRLGPRHSASCCVPPRPIRCKAKRYFLQSAEVPAPTLLPLLVVVDPDPVAQSVDVTASGSATVGGALSSYPCTRLLIVWMWWNKVKIQTFFFLRFLHQRARQHTL